MLTTLNIRSTASVLLSLYLFTFCSRHKYFYILFWTQ